MNIHFAAKALNGDVSSRVTVLCPGPGHSAGDRSLSVTFDAAAPDGFLVNSFANDDWQDCRDHVRDMLGLGSYDGRDRREMAAGHFAHRYSALAPEADQRREFALSLWREAKPIGGTIVERYLAVRSIDIPGWIYSGEAIRFHPSCPFRLDSGETARLPAMVAAMVNIETSAFQGIHRTALRSDGGGKAQVRGLNDVRKMLGRSKGACVKLSPDEDVTAGLSIAEGIETALAVVGNFGIAPVWSTLSAGTLARFLVLPGIECLSIFADNDPERRLPNGNVKRPGTDAAMECAERWTAAGRETVIWTPPDIGSDFNDISGRAAA